MIYIAWLYLIFFVALLICCALFNVSIYRRQWFVIWGGLLIAVLYLAYSYAPFDEDDLAFYYQIIEELRQNSLKWAFLESKYAYEAASNIIFIVVAKLTHTNFLLQLIFMGLLFVHTFLLCMADRNKLLSRQGILLFWIFFSSYFYIRLNLSNLRSPLAFVYFAYGLQLEFSNNGKHKKIAFFYYALSILTHRVAIIFVLFRICAHFLNKLRLKWLAIFLCLWGIIPHILTKLLYFLPWSIFQDLAYKLNAYTTRANTIEDFDPRIRYILFFTVFFLCILVWWISIKKNSYTINKEYLIFVKLSIYFLIGSISYYTILDRSLRFLIVCLLPLWDCVVDSQCKKTVFFVKITGIILLTGMSLYQFVNLYHYYSFS